MTTHADLDVPRPVWQDLETYQGDRSVAMRHTTGHGVPRTITWHLLALRASQVAAGLHAAGVRSGDRVSVLIAPGPSRSAAAYACWRLGAVVVATSPELTGRQRRIAHRHAWSTAVIADGPGLALTRGDRSPRVRLATTRLPMLGRPVLGAHDHLADLVARRSDVVLPPPPSPDDDAALIFALDDSDEPVGVHYSHADLSRVRDLAAERVPADPARRPLGDARPSPRLRSDLRADTARVAASLIVPVPRPQANPWRARLERSCARN